MTEQLPEFYEVKDLSSDGFKRAMQIYAASFPEMERRPEATVKEALKRGKIHMIVCSIGEKIGMMALICPVSGTSFVLIDYLATSQEFRGQGIGGRFLKNVFKLLDELEIDGPKFDHLLVEVEDPGLGLDETKVRRIDFYRRMGMKELKGVRYLLPPMQGDEPTEMKLMVLSRFELERLDEDNGESLDGCEIRDALTRIFLDLYCRSLDDDILARVLEGIPDRISLV